jgi:hypothetical protein
VAWKKTAGNYLKSFIYTYYPSPDRRENPFVPVFGAKDWNDSRKQLLTKPIKTYLCIKIKQL